MGPRTGQEVEMIGGPYDGCTTLLGEKEIRIPLDPIARGVETYGGARVPPHAEVKPYGVYVAAIREGEPVYLWRGEC
jgi:hypothetical protein